MAREAQRLLESALAREADAQRALFDADAERASELFAGAAADYRGSWEEAPPRTYGRLIGMLKASVLAGDADDAAAYVQRELGDEGDSPAAWYAIALAALIRGDDELAQRAAAAMEEGGDAFARTGRAIGALARRDGDGYGEALAEIVADFEAREDHLTGVPIADTALMLERLAQARGLAAGVRSQLLP